MTLSDTTCGMDFRHFLDASLQSVIDEAEEMEAMRLQVYGLHKGNDLLLCFEARDALPLGRDECSYAWYTPDEMLTRIKALASLPTGGIRHVLPPGGNLTGDFHFAHDFGPQEAANIFAQAKAYEAKRVKQLASRLRETTQAVAIERRKR